MSLTPADDPLRRHPAASSAFLIAVVVAIEASLKGGFDLLAVEVPLITAGIISGAVLTVLGALLITRLGLWGHLGLLRRPERLQTLLWFLPFATYGLLPLAAGPHVTPSRAAAAVTFGVLIASWKLIVLALLLHAWLPRGAGTAAALTACLWGTMHLAGILTGGTPAPTLVLALSYVFLSFAFISVRLRTGLIGPLAACYSLFLTAAAFALQNNGATNLVATVSDAMPPLVSSVLLAGYGLLAWKRPAHPTARDTGLVQSHQLLGQSASRPPLQPRPSPSAVEARPSAASATASSPDACGARASAAAARLPRRRP